MAVWRLLLFRREFHRRGTSVELLKKRVLLGLGKDKLIEYLLTQLNDPSNSSPPVH